NPCITPGTCGNGRAPEPGSESRARLPSGPPQTVPSPGGVVTVMVPPSPELLAMQERPATATIPVTPITPGGRRALAAPIPGRPFLERVCAILAPGTSPISADGGQVRGRTDAPRTLHESWGAISAGEAERSGDVALRPGSDRGREAWAARPVIGREEELARLVQILGRKAKNNPVL